jgi:hypothetical protein
MNGPELRSLRGILDSSPERRFSCVAELFLLILGRCSAGCGLLQGIFGQGTYD